MNGLEITLGSILGYIGCGTLIARIAWRQFYLEGNGKVSKDENWMVFWTGFLWWMSMLILIFECVAKTFTVLVTCAPPQLPAPPSDPGKIAELEKDTRILEETVTSGAEDVDVDVMW